MDAAPALPRPDIMEKGQSSRHLPLSPQNNSIGSALSEDERSTAENELLHVHVVKPEPKPESSEPVGHVVKGEPVGHEPQNLVCNLACISINRARRRSLEKGLQALHDRDVALQSPRTCIGYSGPQTCSDLHLKPVCLSGRHLLPHQRGRRGRGEWTPNGARQELQRVNPSLVVVAIRYKDPEDGLNHEGLIDEVVSHCETSGVPYLVVDVRDTPRWQQQS